MEKPQAWTRGFEDQKAGQPFLSNPFAKQTKQGCDATGITDACVWIDGYVDSMIEGRSADGQMVE